MTDAPTLVLFPGMAADARLFERQRNLPYPLITPEWLDPPADVGLPEYAARMAEQVQWPERYVLGGVSFGGMVAAELAAQAGPAGTWARSSSFAKPPEPIGLILIASSLTGKVVPGTYRFINSLSRAIPDQAIRVSLKFSRQFLNVFGEFSEADQEIMADMLRRTSVTAIRRWADMIMHWTGPGAIRCPRIWIHGSSDIVIPEKQLHAAGLEPDVVVPEAGHLMNWTHPQIVNEHIVRFVESL